MTTNPRSPASRVPVRAAFFLAAALWLPLGAAWAQKMVEEVHRIPAEATDAYGKTVRRDMVLTVFKAPDDAPRPLLVLNHGRAPTAEGRAGLGRARYSDAARFLVGQGFIVAVPTRLGYGETGGEDIEDTGVCERKRYAPGYEAGAQLTLQVMAWMRQRPDTLPDRTVVMGQSFGGTIAVAMAAKNPPGVVAAINFAGGGGGNPKTRPGDPCMPGQLERLFGGYGQTARIPTLWIYTENDLFMGPKHPREWFSAFEAAGGVGEFVQFPPNGEDGHGLFSQAPKVWQPKVTEFLQARGLVEPDLPKPPPSGFARLDEADKLPVHGDKAREGYAAWMKSPPPRAFAVDATSGAWGSSSNSGGARPYARAVANCQKHAKAPCRLYAVDDVVVWVAQ